jgi:phenylacetate-CoA ligase
VEVVFSTAEVLHPHQKQIISEALGGVPVANGYGSREAGFISHQCPEGSMHITSENVIVEVVDAKGDPVGPGERGEIIVTQLDCLATPFLRYRTSDVGALRAEKCPCGRGLELMDVVEGRSNDFLIMSDGRRIHSSAIHAALSGLAGICNFQLRQESSGHIRVLLVVDGQWSEESQRKLETNLSERFGSGATFALEYCDEIPPSASGKYRYVISELSALQNTRKQGLGQ